jgi:hypothetical protein
VGRKTYVELVADRQAHDMERTEFLRSMGIKELRFWNSQLRREKQVVRDRIFRELQAPAPHPLPDYTSPMIQADTQKNEK